MLVAGLTVTRLVAAAQRAALVQLLRLVRLGLLQRPLVAALEAVEAVLQSKLLPLVLLVVLGVKAGVAVAAAGLA